MRSLVLVAVLFAGVLCSVKGQSAAGEAPGADTPQRRGPCRTCIFVIERIKQGLSGPREEICEEVWFNSLTKTDYKSCFDTLDALQTWGGHFEGWLAHGCYRKESYGFLRGGFDMILINPCPSHVICGVIANTHTPTSSTSSSKVAVESAAQPFCPKSLDEYDANFFSSDERVRDAPPPSHSPG